MFCRRQMTLSLKPSAELDVEVGGAVWWPFHFLLSDVANLDKEVVKSTQRFSNLVVGTAADCHVADDCNKLR